MLYIWLTYMTEVAFVVVTLPIVEAFVVLLALVVAFVVELAFVVDFVVEVLLGATLLSWWI